MQSGDRGSRPAREGVRISRQAQAGDMPRSSAVRRDFIGLYDREHPNVVRFVMRCGASLSDADNAAEEAFLSAWELVEQGKWAGIVNWRAWLRKVALDAYRRGGTRMRPAAISGTDLPARTSLHDALSPATRLVLEELCKLPPRAQAVIAFDLDGFPVPVIATHLGETDQDVRRLLRDARAILAARLAGMTQIKEGGIRDRS